MLVHLSTHFSKYFNLFSIFLLCLYIFTIFDFFPYIICLFSKKGKGKERAATVESVTSHASIRQKPWRAFGG